MQNKNCPELNTVHLVSVSCVFEKKHDSKSIKMKCFCAFEHFLHFNQN